jgi:hypothetical protein
VERCLDVLTEDDLWWRPHEQSNAVGNLVLHVAGSNRHFLEHVIGGAPGVRDRDAEFAVRGGQTKADLLQIWSDVARRVDGVLRTLTPERLAEPTRDRNRSVADILLHVTITTRCTSGRSSGSPSCAGRARFASCCGPGQAQARP